MATMTSKIVITWVSREVEQNPDLEISRAAKLASMTTDGKTDGTFIRIENPERYDSERHFADSSAAQEYGDFIVAECGRLQLAAPTFVISAL